MLTTARPTTRPYRAVPAGALGVANNPSHECCPEHPNETTLIRSDGDERRRTDVSVGNLLLLTPNDGFPR
jgi:hypothetical protein